MHTVISIFRPGTSFIIAMTSPNTAKNDVTHTLSGYAAIACAKFPRENFVFAISPITIFACKKNPCIKNILLSMIKNGVFWGPRG